MNLKRHITRTCWFAMVAMICMSCAKPFYHYGAANDRTGTNGATTGTGKVATP